MIFRPHIVDNFLSNSDFIELTNNILPKPVGVNEITNFIWMYANKQVPSENEQDRFKNVTDIELSNPIHQWFLSHLLWEGGYRSRAIHYFDVLLDKIEPLAVHRDQANFTVQQEKRGRSLFHIDYKGEPFKFTSMITSIFYINTTNGPTVLEDGTEIECRANRLVSFPYNTYHAGVLCTDQPYRIVINLNYFKDMIINVTE